MINRTRNSRRKGDREEGKRYPQVLSRRRSRDSPGHGWHASRWDEKGRKREQAGFTGLDIMFTTRNAPATPRPERPDVSCWELAGRIYERRDKSFAFLLFFVEWKLASLLGGVWKSFKCGPALLHERAVRFRRLVQLSPSHPPQLGSACYPLAFRSS